ncbi:hypothetical protein EV207_12810 [Scopulibacillus darangshiensis]|uniref:Uncharacterized protein n=1 Tax=Scopulibacillus darangshiensis TaxID=442528 RepID=A0A4R2NPV6_9BACL|nr:hypothetical protein EV207_12810 [Scopulibacillus darangshiensis]
MGYRNESNVNSCERYCLNVCVRLFPGDFGQCFNDCVSCQRRADVLSDFEDNQDCDDWEDDFYG